MAEDKTYHVYILFDIHRRLLYIGYTGNIKRRMYQHKETIAAHSYLSIFQGSKEVCQVVELSFIKLFKVHIDKDDFILNKMPDFGREMYLTEI
jgi:hypothetical protein